MSTYSCEHSTYLACCPTFSSGGRSEWPSAEASSRDFDVEVVAAVEVDVVVLSGSEVGDDVIADRVAAVAEGVEGVSEIVVLHSTMAFVTR